MHSFSLWALVLVVSVLYLTNPTNQAAIRTAEVNPHLVPPDLPLDRLRLSRADYWIYSDFYLTVSGATDGRTYVFTGFLG